MFFYYAFSVDTILSKSGNFPDTTRIPPHSGFFYILYGEKDQRRLLLKLFCIFSSCVLFLQDVFTVFTG